MYNYEHEIEKPINKSIEKFLWNDYFHDSVIEDIAFDYKKNQLMITILSVRDEDNKWNKLRGSVEQKRQQLKDNADKFRYILYFEKVKHFTFQSAVNWTQYLNGRFKDSANLKIMKSWDNENLFHFRLQTADGFSDIIFGDFKIRKKIGKVNYNFENDMWQSDSIPMGSSYFISEKSKNQDGYLRKFVDIDEYIQEAKNGKDFDRFIAMSVLYEKNYDKLLDLARNNLILNSEWLDCSAYAAYLLGKIGTYEDISKLYEFHAFLNRMVAKENNFPHNIFIERTVLDSIEFLNYKNK